MGKEGAPNKFMTFNEVTYPNQEDYESLFIDNYIQPNDTAFAKSQQTSYHQHYPNRDITQEMEGAQRTSIPQNYPQDQRSSGTRHDQNKMRYTFNPDYYQEFRRQVHQKGPAPFGQQPSNMFHEPRNSNQRGTDDPSFISAIIRDKDASQLYINNTNISIQNSFINGSFVNAGQIPADQVAAFTASGIPEVQTSQRQTADKAQFKNQFMELSKKKQGRGEERR